jgi:hypothetical protein
VHGEPLVVLEHEVASGTGDELEVDHVATSVGVKEDKGWVGMNRASLIPYGTIWKNYNLGVLFANMQGDRYSTKIPLPTLVRTSQTSLGPSVNHLCKI